MDIIFSGGKYSSSNGKDTIHYSVWEGEGRKGIVHLVHGMCEYAGRYDDFARFLVRSGYIVCAQDHIGHGLTAPNSEALGFFANNNGDHYLVEDTRLLKDIITVQYPGLPYIIFGHSMGSFIARCFFEKYGKSTQKAIFCGTSGKNPAGGLVIFIGKVTKLFCGKHARGKAIDKLIGKIYLSRIKNPKTKYDWISTDEEIVRKYSLDKFCTYIFTASAYIDLMKLLNRCNSKQWFANIPKNKPILIISGAEDPVGNYGEGPREVFQKLNEAFVEKTDIIVYPDLRHEVLNEKSRNDVYEDVLAWLSQA